MLVARRGGLLQTLLLLDAFHEPLAFALLRWREFVFLAFVRILAGLETQSYGRALELECFAKSINQKTAIGLR